jgi:type I restriction enzyme M protein
MTDLAKPEQQLLDLMKQHDSLGNGKARELLGWDEALYEQVKGSLVAAGEVVLGRGRGGSIRLAEASAVASAKAEPSGQQANRPSGQPAFAKPSAGTQAPEPKAYKPLSQEAKKPKAAQPRAYEPTAQTSQTEQQFLQDRDKKLWTAADRLRSSLDAVVGKDAVPSLTL